MNAESLPRPDFNNVAQTWEKWEEWLEPCYIDFNQKFLQKGRIKEGDFVLDLGCGAGYPAILEAQSVGPLGKVQALDISPEMLAVARRRAGTLGLRNIDFQRHDVDSLPFPENAFDCVTARFCLMFLAAPARTLKEAYRVLKKGGTFVACVWGPPEKNPLPRQVLQRYADLPKEDPDEVGPFRFATAQKLADILTKMGFLETHEEEIIVKESFTSGTQYVQHLLESSATWRSILIRLPPDQLQEATEALRIAAEDFRTGERVEIPRCVRLVSASK